MSSSILIISYISYLIGVWLVALLPALAVAVGGFIYSLYTKRNDIADVLWPVGIAASAITLFLILDYPSVILKLVIVLITIWATRLAYHIGTRHFAKSKEDKRYARWREEWTWVRTRSFFQVFALQAVLMVVLLSPVIVFVFNPGDVPLWQVLLGVWLWLVGFTFEVVGDWQLAQFLRTPSRYGLKKGDLMTKGVWSITRHPNYFGEICMWWGIFIIMLHSLNVWQLVPAIIGPAIFTYIIYYVSGVKLTEHYWAQEFSEQFKKYKQATPILIPRIFRRGS